MSKSHSSGLTARQVQGFIDDGFVRLDQAFPATLAADCRAELWTEIGFDPTGRTGGRKQ